MPATGTIVGSPEIIPVPGVPGVRGLSISPRRLAPRVCRTRLEQSDLGAAGHGWTARRPGPSRALTSDTSRRNSLPVISPDGTKVAYMSSRRGERPNLWMMDIDGRHSDCS